MPNMNQQKANVQLKMKPLPTEGKKEGAIAAKNDTNKNIELHLKNATSALEQTAQQLSSLPLLDAANGAADGIAVANVDGQMESDVWRIHSTNPVYLGSTDNSPNGKAALPTRITVQPLKLPSPSSSPSRASQASSLPGSARKAVAVEYPRSFPVTATAITKDMLVADALVSPDIGNLSGWMKRNRELQTALQAASPEAKPTSSAAVTHKTKDSTVQQSVKNTTATAATTATATKKQNSTRQVMIMATAAVVLLLLLTAALVFAPGIGLLAVPRHNTSNNDVASVLTMESVQSEAQGSQKSMPPPVATAAVVEKQQQVPENPAAGGINRKSVEPTPKAKPSSAAQQHQIEAPKQMTEEPVTRTTTGQRQHHNKQQTGAPQPASPQQTKSPQIQRLSEALRHVLDLSKPYYLAAVVAAQPYMDPVMRMATPYFTPVAALFNSLDPETKTLAAIAGATSTVVFGIAVAMVRRARQVGFSGDSSPEDDGSYYADDNYNTPGGGGAKKKGGKSSSGLTGVDGDETEGLRSSRSRPKTVKRLVSQQAKKTPNGQISKQWNRV